METWLARRGLYKRKQVHFSCPVIGPAFRPGARYGSWVEGLGGWLGYEKRENYLLILGKMADFTQSNIFQGV